MKSLSVGVIGVGHLGSLHATMLKSLPDAVLAGVFDVDKDRAQSVAAGLGTVAFTSLTELLEAVDAATVATPTVHHFAVSREALMQGKHLFIEKPITQTVAEAGELCDLARRHGLVLQVGHIERFNPAILALEGHLIQPMFVESHRLAQFKPRGADVAVVLDLMIHDIDLILSFVRSPVKQVDASGVAVVSDTIDIANARLQFENGCVANVTASRISQRKMRKMRLFQKDSYISIDFSEGLAEVFRILGEDEEEGRGTLLLGEIGQGSRKRRIVYEQPDVKDINALQHELGLFVGAVRTGALPVVSGDDGKRALEVANTILERISQQAWPA